MRPESTNVTAPAVFTRTRGDQTAVVTLTPLGPAELEYRISLNGVEVPQDTDVAEFDCTADRDQAFTDTIAVFQSNGYTRVA